MDDEFVEMLYCEYWFNYSATELGRYLHENTEHQIKCSRRC